jgi:hypothetical protein
VGELHALILQPAPTNGSHIAPGLGYRSLCRNPALCYEVGWSANTVIPILHIKPFSYLNERERDKRELPKHVAKIALRTSMWNLEGVGRI